MTQAAGPFTSVHIKQACTGPLRSPITANRQPGLQQLTALASPPTAACFVVAVIGGSSASFHFHFDVLSKAAASTLNQQGALVRHSRKTREPSAHPCPLAQMFAASVPEKPRLSKGQEASTTSQRSSTVALHRSRRKKAETLLSLLLCVEMMSVGLCHHCNCPRGHRGQMSVHRKH